MKIDVVDNGGQWTHREWRMFKYLEVDSDIIPNDKPVDNIKVDGLVLSGGAPRISNKDMSLGKTEEYIERMDVPILGICVGAQFLARYFGGETGSAETPEYGKTDLEVVKEDDLFIDIPKGFVAWESHNDEIKELSEDLEKLAFSESCAIQAFKHKDRKLYGLQFHPEVEHTEYGKEIFENFVEVCRDSKR
ncbi:MAG: GMP synthase subunit A [Candidatus Thermoplasmatota archaeon]|nr:GMP synthase subunit A [Candidatus Thermoplasmatota archaeon]